MRSAVNPAMFGRSRVPDNRHHIGAFASIAGNIKQGLDKRRASSLQEDLLATASAATAEQPQALAPPQTIEDRQAELVQGQIDIAEEQQLNATQQKAAQARDQLQRQTTWKTLTSDPEMAGKMMELQKLDPNMAKGVANILVSRDAEQIEGLQREAVAANTFNHNLGALAIDPSVSDADVKNLIRGRAAQLKEQGASFEQLAPLMSMDRDEIHSHARQQMLLSGQAHQIAERAKPMILSKDQVAFDANGQVIASNRVEEQPAPMSEYQRESLALKRQELQGGGNKPLTTSDVRGLNNDVGKIVAPVAAIHAAASSLDGLKESGTATDQIAAIFKFMKSLDPSSSVRESEAGMVFAAEGIAGSIAAQLNQAQGEGGLSKENFSRMVATAKNLANSAIDSGSSEVEGYLSGFGDDIPSKRKDAFRGRLPKRFEDDRPSPELEQARAAIEAGAPREAVIQRMQENGFNTEGL